MEKALTRKRNLQVTKSAGSPGNLPDPGIEPASPVSRALAGGFFTTGKPFLLKVNKRQNYFSFGLFLLMFWTMFYFK